MMNSYLYIDFVERYCFEHFKFISLNIQTEVVDVSDVQCQQVRVDRETLNIDKSWFMIAHFFIWYPSCVEFLFEWYLKMVK